MTLTDQVANSGKSGVPAPAGMPAPQGVSSEMPEQEAVDVGKLQEQVSEYERKLKELEEARERDVAQLRSTLDQTYSQKERDYETRIRDYEDKMHQAAMANMDEQERIAYRLQVAEDRNRQLREAAERAQREADANRGMMSYAQGFMQQGVKFEELDFSDISSVYASGWAALERRNRERDQQLDTLRQEVEAYKSGQGPAPNQATASGVQRQPQAQPQRQTTQVVTQHGQQPSGTKSIGDVIRALEAQFPGQKFDEDKVFTWIERRYISPEILDDVDWGRTV
jgi:hypothetical protein